MRFRLTLLVLWVVTATGCFNRDSQKLIPEATIDITPSALPADGLSTAKIETCVSFSTQQGATQGTFASSARLQLNGNRPGAVFEQPAAGPDPNGCYVGSIRSDTPGTLTVSASLIIDGQVLPLSMTALVTFNDLSVTGPGVPCVCSSTLAANPNVVSADGITVTELVLTVLDSTGVPVPATPVTFVVSGTHNVLNDAIGITGPDGVFTATLASSTPETKTITAHAGDMATTTQVAFTLSAPSQLNSTLVANPNALPAGNATALALTVQDALGRAIDAVSVTWSSTGRDINFGSTSERTDAAGNAQTTLQSTAAETKRVTATVGAARVSTLVVFQPLVASQIAVNVGSGNGVSFADGRQTIALSAMPTDVYGNGISAQAVTFSGVAGTLFTPASGATDGNGLLQASATSTVAVAQNVNVTSASLFGTATMTFVAGAAVTGSSSLTINPNSVLADGQTPAAVSLTLRDGFSNPTPGVVIVLSASGTHNSIVPNSGLTDANGTFVGTMTSTYAESKVVLATFAGGTLNANVTFLHGNANSNTSTLTADTTNVSADGVSTATLVTTVLDAFGNPVPNTPVSWSATGSSVTLTPQGTTTDANGQVVATLSSTVVQSSTVSAVVGSGATFTETLTVQFTSGAPSSSTSTLVATPSSLVANGSSTSIITMTLRDQGGNPLPGQTVTASTDGVNSNLSPLSGTTDGAGMFSANLTSTRAQIETITMQAGGISKTASVTFVAGAPNATYSTFTASPNQLIANGSAACTLTFSVFDAQNNPVIGASVTFASSGTSNTVTPGVTTTNTAGVATAALRSTYAESKNVSAKSGGLAQTASVVFSAGAATNVTSTLVVNPNQQTADGSTVAIAVTVLDANNNPLSAQTVNLGSTGTANTITPLSGQTNLSGIFNATWSSTKAEGKALTASVAGITLNANATFVAGAPTSAASSFTVNPTTLTADGVATSVLTVTLTDSMGNAVSSQAVTFASSGTNNNLAPITTSTNAAGVATATFASTTAEVKSVTAKSGALIQNASITFQAGSPNATTTTFAATPNTVAGDGSSASTLTFRVLDAKGNPEVSVPVTISATGTNNTLNPNAGNTDITGAFVTTLKSTTPETKVVTAVGAGITKNANVVFTTAVVNVANSTFTASPTTLTANGVATTTLTVNARNGSNAPVVGAAVTFTSTGTAYTFSPASGVTDASGNFNATLASTKAETKTVTANVSGTNLNANVIFTAGNANNTTSTFVVNPTSLTANGVTTSTLTMTMTDTFGNPVSGQAVTFASTGGNNTLTPMTTTTGASGTATATLASIRAEAKSVTATSGTISKNASVTFIAGAASNANTTFTASPTTNITADGVATSTLTANVSDAFGNPITGQPVSLNSNGSNDVFSPAPSGVTNAGIFSATLASTKAEAKIITATIGGFNKTANVTFVAGSPNVTHSSVSAPGNPVADGTTSETVTVTVNDAQGNPITGQLVSIASSDGVDTFTPASGNTSGGTWTSAMKTTHAGTKTLTATVGSYTVTTTVTFVAGPATNANSTFTASPTSLPGDGNAATILTLTLQDAHGNPVSGQAATFSGSTGNITFSPASGSTNTGGTLTSMLKSTVTQTTTVTAAFAGLSQTAQVTFTAGAPSSATSSVTATPTSLTADGSSVTNVTVTIKDSSGNPINGQLVNLAATGTGNTFGATSGNTNASGVFSTTLKSTVAQSKTITATAGAVSVTTNVTFVHGPVSTVSTLVANPNSLAADGSTQTTLTVAAKDATGNIVPSQAVTFSSSGTNYTFSATTGTTDGTGALSVTLESTKAEVKTVTAKMSGIQVTAAVTFVAGAPSSPNSTFVASPHIVANNNITTTTLTATLADMYGNPVSNRSVTLNANGTNNNFGSATGVTDANGVYSTTLKSSTAQTKAVSVTASPTTLYTSVIFVSTCSTIALTTHETVSLTAAPAAVAAADYSNDGYDDYVVVGPARFDSRKGIGNGNTNYDTGFGGGPVPNLGVILADFNNTGYLEAAVADAGTTQVAVYPNSSAGFDFDVDTSTPASPNSVTAGDLNADGRIDILVTLPSVNAVAVLKNGGGNSFTIGSNIAVGSKPIAAAIADFDGDNKPDAVVADGSDANMSFLRGTGSYAFAASVPVAVGGTPGDIVVADFNNDGHQDAALILPATNQVSTLLGKGNGAFQSATFTTVGTNPITLRAGDIDGNGIEDLLVANSTSSNLSVLMGLGDGTFASPQNTTLANKPSAIALGDFNGDGKLDAVVAYPSPMSSAILLSSGCP